MGLSAVATESEEMGLPELLETSQIAGNRKTLYPFSFEDSEPRLASKEPTRTWGTGHRATCASEVGSYFRGIAFVSGRTNTPWKTDRVWRTLPVGTGRYSSNSRVALSAITVRIRRPPHVHSTQISVCYNDCV
jgi:hypothetical protein